jgi:hypothetical protein
VVQQVEVVEAAEVAVLVDRDAPAGAPRLHQ